MWWCIPMEPVSRANDLSLQSNGSTYYVINPMVDIIVPVYNAAPYLKEAIDSLLNQTFSDFRIILINDGSTDNSLEIIQSYDDPRIAIINMPKNGGIVKALNAGLSAATAKYIARFDADDNCVNDRLEKQVNYLEKNPDVGVLGGQMEIFGGNSNHIYTSEQLPIHHEDIVISLVFKNVMAHPTVMFRKSLLDDNGLSYSSDFPHMEDYDLWLKLIKLTKFHNLNDVLIRYRMMGQNISVKNNSTYSKRLFDIHSHYYPKLNITLKGQDLTLFEFGFENGHINVEKNSIKKYRRMLKLLETNTLLNEIASSSAIKKRIDYLWNRNFVPILKRGKALHVFYYWSLGKRFRLYQVKLLALKLIGRI